MIFVFPMAGESSRFKKAGYKLPKYQLPFKEHSVFDEVIAPFYRISENHKFIFVCRNNKSCLGFLENKLAKYNFKNAKVISLVKSTSGQAETAYLGLSSSSKDESLAIFNIDTFHKNYQPISFESEEYKDSSGILEVFEDSGSNWSFAKVFNEKVVQTSEKVPISNLASNGMYYFKSVQIFKSTYESFFYGGQGVTKGERYIAPMYNELIAHNHIVKVKKIAKKDLTFCGTPEEYEGLL